MLALPRPSGRARALLAFVWAFALLLPASTTLSKTQWNLHIWQRLRAARRVSPETGLDQYSRKLLPYLPEQGALGFQVVGGPDDRREEFRLQYALAPRRIVRSTLTEFVIECGSAASADSLGRNPHFSLVSIVGDDLRLFRKIQP